MIKFLLRELEKSPFPLFSKKELLAFSPEGFKELTERKLLTYYNPPEGSMENLHYPRCQHGCPLTKVEIKGRLEAVCLEHPEEDPIPIGLDDLNRYAFSVENFLNQLRIANKIDGTLSKINGDYYIGYKNYSSYRIGFIFCYKIGKDTLIKLMGFKNQCKDDYIIIVLCPVSKIEDVNIKSSLYHENIIQDSLSSILNLQTFEFPIDKMLSELLKPEEITALTEEQKSDFEKFKFLCYDKIHIPGTKPMKRNNLIVVNENEIRIPDSSFRLLLRFVVELKKKEGGWINIYDLEKEGIINDAGKYEPYNRLRDKLKNYLLVKDGEKFIQNDGENKFRISTHPDFITYDRENLLLYKDARIILLVKELP